MTKSFRKLFVAIALAFASPCISLAADTLTIRGSSTIKPVIDRAAIELRETRPDLKIVVETGGSVEGIRAIGAREVSIGTASRELTDREAAKYPHVVSTPIGYDGIAIILNAANSCDVINTAQVRQIYTGSIGNWKQVGGADAEIVRFSRHKKSGSHDLFIEYLALESNERVDNEVLTTFMKWKKGDPGNGARSRTTIGGNEEIIELVAKTPHGIGYSSLGAAEHAMQKGQAIKLLSLDGVAAGTKNIANGSYPLCRPLQLLTDGEPTGERQLFIEFMLGSRGQRIVRDGDLVPIHP